MRSQGDAAKLVLQAEGIRTSVVNRAKVRAPRACRYCLRRWRARVAGSRPDLTLRCGRLPRAAQGEADAKLLVAKAEAGAVRRLREATSVHGVKASEYLVAIQYLNSLKNLSQGAGNPNTKAVLLPANSLSTISSIMRYSRPQAPTR